ncbi:hypothetical protein [Shimia sp.]|uniref:hypothetical protein n=1 Tax=Shimia sp. TaxID=1954381 RepID=UPI00329717C9
MTRFTKLAGICAATAALAASPVLGAGPDAGCYQRAYTPQHLAKYPAQIVERITMDVHRDINGDKVASLWVDLASQGHVGRTKFAGQRVSQFLFCYDQQGQSFCGVECDGGGFVVTKQSGTSLTFRTDYLMVGDTDECGGAVDLAEVQGQDVSYRLDRVNASICAAR